MEPGVRSHHKGYVVGGPLLAYAARLAILRLTLVLNLMSMDQEADSGGGQRQVGPGHER